MDPGDRAFILSSSQGGVTVGVRIIGIGSEGEPSNPDDGEGNDGSGTKIDPSLLEFRGVDAFAYDPSAPAVDFEVVVQTIQPITHRVVCLVDQTRLAQTIASAGTSVVHVRFDAAYDVGLTFE